MLYEVITHCSGEVYHVGAWRHLGVVGYGGVVTLGIDLAKHIGFFNAVNIGHGFRIVRVGDECPLIGVVMTHHAVHIGGLDRVGRIAIGPDVAGKTRRFS